MNTSVEISYHPLHDEYLAPIGNFIDRLHSHEGLIIRTNGMSTQIFGDFDDVMGCLTAEIKKSFELPHSVFTLKIINADLQSIPTA